MKKIEQITDKRELLDFLFLVEMVYTEDETEREMLLRNALKKARELGVSQEFKEKVAELTETKKREDEEQRLRHLCQNGTELEKEKNGTIRKTIENFLLIFRGDEIFSTVRFNELTGKGEYNGKAITDSVRSSLIHHIEKVYSLKSEKDFDHALSILLSERKYHPVREKIAGLEWDKKPRIEDFLHRVMGAEESDYIRECSRLIFHCAIARIFNPGCKVDDVIVLQGEQGNGKSTLVSWLAMNDDWYGRVNDIRGNTGIEQIQGKWICEISELLAVTGRERQEEAKQYLDRKSDNYRRPYAQFSEDLPRQCIFIGTTNLRQPFSDRTGNRRYYPVWCNIKRGELYDHEGAVKKYIEQCWAEAYDLWQKGEIRHTVKKEMFAVVAEMQENALEDDWRTGYIENFLKDKTETCIIEIWTEALGMPDKPVKKQSNEIAVILDNLVGWERGEGNKNIGKYSKQRFWKIKETAKLVPYIDGYDEVVEIQESQLPVG